MSDRFDVSGGEPTMNAVVTMGNGGYEKLVYRRVPIPQPQSGDVLLKVLAAGINNTEINTRLGWYSSDVDGATSDTAESQQNESVERQDGGWNAATPFPFIQGTDCCGEVVRVGADVSTEWLSKRVLVRACMRPEGFDSYENHWMASDFDGAFAEFVVVPATEIFAVDCDWSDAELATIPCAYATAENMLHRSAVSGRSRVLITGASGGVGSAAVQLAKRRGAHVTAIAGRAKLADVAALGADAVVARDTDLEASFGENAFDVVVDNVAGAQFGSMLKLLKRGGRYTSSGAIAGPVVALDMRDFYLKDLNLIGCTAWDEPVFPNLVRYIEDGEIRPLLAKTFELSDIVNAQKEFMLKQHVGKFVLTINHVGPSA
ncbi:MAG: alcohol dehydrogenase family protein [Pseudomonadota bacterium]